VLRTLTWPPRRLGDFVPFPRHCFITFYHSWTLLCKALIWVAKTSYAERRNLIVHLTYHHRETAESIFRKEQTKDSYAPVIIDQPVADNNRNEAGWEERDRFLGKVIYVYDSRLAEQ
jgi:hypothetical protein